MRPNMVEIGVHSFRMLCVSIIIIITIIINIIIIFYYYYSYYKYYYYSLIRAFPTSVSRWLFTGVWVTTSLL